MASIERIWEHATAVFSVIIALVLYIYIVTSFSIPASPFQTIITVIIWAVPTIAMLGAVLSGKKSSLDLVGVAIAIPIISLLFSYFSPVLTNALPANATGMEGAFVTLANLFFKDSLALVFILLPVLTSIMDGFGAIREAMRL